MRVKALGLCGLLAALAISSATFLHAQGAASGRVVVRAITSDGQPVLDLKREDVSIRIDGREREVKSLELVQPTAGAPPAAASAPAAPVLPAPYVTNTRASAGPAGGREFLIAVDDEGIAPGREIPVREAITAIVGKLSPADRVGLVAMKQGGVNVAPTSQHSAVLEALPRITGLGSMSESELDLTCRTQVILGNLAGFLEGAGPERVVVFFSPAVALQNLTTVRTIGKGTESVPCDLRAEDLEALGRAAAASGAQTYVIAYPEGLGNAANRQNGQAGLENVAGVTRAEYVVFGGEPETVANRIMRAAGVYYLATIDGAAAGRRWDVRVGRDGVRASAAPAAGGAAAPAGGKASPRDMIRTTAVYADLPLRAAAFVSRQAGSKDLQVMTLFASEDPEAKFNAASVLLATSSGGGRAWNARPEDLQRTPVMAMMATAPGKYRMRVAATDASGRGGTADLTLDAQLMTVDQAKFGSLVLGTDQNSPKLLFTATDQAVIGFLPVYDLAKDAQLSVIFEIRESETAAPLGTTDGKAIPMPNDPTAQMVWGGFGLGPLQPGDYLMRAVVTINGKEAGVVQRTLRKLK